MLINSSILVGIALVLVPCTVPAQEVPFQRGVNLTNWFQVASANQIQFTKYTRVDFENIKSLGCDVIRLPINLHAMSQGAPDYTLSPLFFEFLDQAVSWAEDLEMHLILDNHTFDPMVGTDPNVGEILKAVWTQMAAHYQGNSEYIYYEILNEPHDISDELWNSIQQDVVAAIREIDSKHFIIVGPANWNSFYNLDSMLVYEDEKLIYTFHFYEPFIFTHQGATWTTPSLGPLSGVPFPYDTGTMPLLPNELTNTWIESAFNNYQNSGNVNKLKELVDIAVNFRNSRNVPVYCGEFGVYQPNSANTDRVYWYQELRQYLEENNIPWTLWDYQGGFGLFDANSNELFQHDLNISMLEALAFDIPEQTEYQMPVDSSGFLVYSDYIGRGLEENSSDEGDINYYSSELPNNDRYCLSWAGAEQYNTVGFDITPNKDLGYLVENNYAVDFIIRGNVPVKFDMCFIDTDTEDPQDHPWRMRITLDESDFPFDGRWHHLHVPLQDFTEQGAWEGEWFPPEGRFDWAAIDRFEIVAEHQDFGSAKLWFDNIYITNLDTAGIHEFQVLDVVTSIIEQTPDVQYTIYPNPASNQLIVTSKNFNLQEAQIADPLGRVILNSAFREQVVLDISSLSPGLYLVKLRDEQNATYTRKFLKN